MSAAHVLDCLAARNPDNGASICTSSLMTASKICKQGFCLFAGNMGPVNAAGGALLLQEAPSWPDLRCAFRTVVFGEKGQKPLLQFWHARSRHERLGRSLRRATC